MFSNRSCNHCERSSWMNLYLQVGTYQPIYSTRTWQRSNSRWTDNHHQTFTSSTEEHASSKYLYGGKKEYFIIHILHSVLLLFEPFSSVKDIHSLTTIPKHPTDRGAGSFKGYKNGSSQTTTPGASEEASEVTIADSVSCDIPNTVPYILETSTLWNGRKESHSFRGLPNLEIFGCTVPGLDGTYQARLHANVPMIKLFRPESLAQQFEQIEEW